MTGAGPRLLADRMLGRLSKWLRIMGVDCDYVRSGSRDEIVERALEQNRTLLTRDTRLINRRRLGAHLFIDSDHLERQIVQVLRHFRIDPLANAFSRCIRCNRPLEQASPAEAGARVPVYVRDSQPTIARCKSCKRFYWRATHIGRMQKRLSQYKQACQAADRHSDPTDL